MSLRVNSQCFQPRPSIAVYRYADDALTKASRGRVEYKIEAFLRCLGRSSFGEFGGSLRWCVKDVSGPPISLGAWPPIHSKGESQFQCDGRQGIQ